MKRIPRMTIPLQARNLAAIVLSAAALAPCASADKGEVIFQAVGNVPYVSGGVGLDSIDRLDMMANQFNLKLVFALKSGEYLSEVKVTITDAAGRAIVDALSDGPWFLTKLPQGKYQVVANFAGRAERRTVAVGATRLSTVDFRWASE